MKQIICFGDSNTWGYDGESKERLPWGKRWTSLLQEKLIGDDIRIIEEGLCGRTSIFEDPLREGRKGTALLPVLLETHATADLLILMLGTNDCKTIFKASAQVIASGMERLIDQAKRLSPQTKILLISPITLGEKVWQEGYDPEFSRESVEVSKALSAEFKKLAEKKGIFFLDAAKIVSCCEADQEHMNAEGHSKFADALYEKLMLMIKIINKGIC